MPPGPHPRLHAHSHKHTPNTRHTSVTSPMTHMLLPSLCSRGIMGNLLKPLACNELEHGSIIFLDFERETISFLCFEFAFLSLLITVPHHSLSSTFSLPFLHHPSVCASMPGIQGFFFLVTSICDVTFLALISRSTVIRWAKGRRTNATYFLAVRVGWKTIT